MPGFFIALTYAFVTLGTLILKIIHSTLSNKRKKMTPKQIRIILTTLCSLVSGIVYAAQPDNTALNTSLKTLQQQMTALNTQCIELSTLSHARAIENSHLRLQTQSRFEQACDFFAAAGTLALPVLHFAPCIAPITVPTVVIYGAKALCAVSTLKYWLPSVTNQWKKMRTHNNMIMFNTSSYQYHISFPLSRAISDRLYDFTAASFKIIGLAGAGAALCMFAHKNKASMPTI